MPKSLRSAKRRHHEITSTSAAAPPSTSYVSNVQMAEGEDSLDNILAEMAGQQGINLSPSVPSSSSYSIPINTTTLIPETLPVTETPETGEDDTADATTTTAKLLNTTIPTRPNTKQQLERIRSWNSIMNTWQRTGTFHNNSTISGVGDGIFVPSFDVEMTRHFKIQALSSYLLDTCKGLKMPAFERWLIDSKVEESTHTYSASAKFDPVLSGNVTAQYQSSQRLMDEICEMNDKKKEKADGKAVLSTTSSKKKSKTASSSATTPILKRNDIKKIVQELCRRTNVAVLEIAQQQSIYQQQQQNNNNSSSSTNRSAALPIKRGDRIELEGHPPVYTLVYHRDKKWKKPYCIKINATHYNKLYAMFVQVHHSTTAAASTNDNHDDPLLPLVFKDRHGKLTMTTHVFHYLVMILLLRYSSLSGGQLLLDLRGGGMQGAVHDSVFETLSQCFVVPSLHDTMVECFASPLNAYLSSGYCSAFGADIDWHFGSRGNFWTEWMWDGCCEANPPFAPGLMSAMADRIQCNIDVANERDSMVTFIVIVPHGGSDHDVHRAVAKRSGSVALQQMTRSEYCTMHLILPAKEHGYIEGAQHLRPTRYKESLYDTSVVVLQSHKARIHTKHNHIKNNKNTTTMDQNMFEEQIRQAFMSRHRMEVERRK